MILAAEAAAESTFTVPFTKLFVATFGAIMAGVALAMAGLAWELRNMLKLHDRILFGEDGVDEQGVYGLVGSHDERLENHDERIEDNSEDISENEQLIERHKTEIRKLEKEQ